MLRVSRQALTSLVLDAMPWRDLPPYAAAAADQPPAPPLAAYRFGKGIVRWQPGESAEQFLSQADIAMHDEKMHARARGQEKQTA